MEQSYFYIIPAKLVQDGEVSPLTCMLYGLIYSLISDEGYCYAGNTYLAKKLKVGDRHIRRMLNELVATGWLRIEVSKDDTGTKRKIFTVFTREGEAKNSLPYGTVEPTGEAENSLPVNDGLDTVATIETTPKKEGSSKVKSSKVEYSNNTYVEELKVLVDKWNATLGKKFKPNPSLLPSFTYWRECYSLEEMLTAIPNILADRFWVDKMTPEMLLRRKNPRGEAVDYIGKFLNATAPKEFSYSRPTDYSGVKITTVEV